ncbi:MAG: hypothetical protein ACM34K_05725 [Bacillota bacterium]
MSKKETDQAKKTEVWVPVENESKPALYNAGEIELLLGLNKFQVIRLEHYLVSNKIEKEMTVAEWEAIIKSL